MTAPGPRSLPSLAPKCDESAKKRPIIWAFSGMGRLLRPVVVAPLHFRMVALGGRDSFMHVA
jgi:hypothetical protein